MHSGDATSFARTCIYSIWRVTRFCTQCSTIRYIVQRPAIWIFKGDLGYKAKFYHQARRHIIVCWIVKKIITSCILIILSLFSTIKNTKTKLNLLGWQQWNQVCLNGTLHSQLFLGKLNQKLLDSISLWRQFAFYPSGLTGSCLSD